MKPGGLFLSSGHTKKDMSCTFVCLVSVLFLSSIFVLLLLPSPFFSLSWRVVSCGFKLLSVNVRRAPRKIVPINGPLISQNEMKNGESQYVDRDSRGPESG